MDKQALLYAMNNALKITRQKDKIYKEYCSKSRAVNNEQEKLENFPISARIKISLIPFVLFCISAGTQNWENSKLAYNITLALFILLIAVNVVGKYIYFFTGEFKRKSAENNAKIEAYRKEYVPQLMEKIEASHSATA